MRKLCAAVAMATCCAGAQAWEADVHEGLTYWLARQAGANREAARDIAKGNQLSDTGVFDATHLMLHYACLGADDLAASVSVRERHFATDGALPGLPAKRKVQAGSAVAWEEVKARLSVQGGAIDREKQLFGLALHRLQDSWSHQGEPDIPTIFKGHLCNKQIAWAHPEKRHGWYRHDADLTHLWPDDLLASAEATYKALLEFVELHKQEIGEASPAPFDAVMKEMPAFQKAKTKAEKRAWFLAHAVRQDQLDLAFLRLITLEDGDQRFDQPIALALRVRVLDVPKPPAGVPDEVARFFAAFFRDWTRSDDFGATVAAHVDVPAARSTMALTAASDGDAAQQLAQTLRFWRVRDHGRAAALDHRPFSSLRAGAPLSINALADFALARYETLAQALHPVFQSGAAQSFAIFAAPGGKDRYLAAAKFTHAPSDTVLVSVEKLKNGYRVVAIDSMVEH